MAKLRTRDGKKRKEPNCPKCNAIMALQERMRADFRELVNPFRCPKCGWLEIEYLKSREEEVSYVV